MSSSRPRWWWSRERKERHKWDVLNKLIRLAGGDVELVNDAIRAAALRGLIQRDRHVAELPDVIAYIKAKRPAHC